MGVNTAWNNGAAVGSRAARKALPDAVTGAEVRNAVGAAAMILEESRSSSPAPAQAVPA